MVDERAEAEDLRRDKRANLHALALALLERTDAKKTTAPSWKFLQERTGRARSSIAAYLADLQRWGLLGVVASGRRGIYAPGGRYSRRMPPAGHTPAPAQSDPANEVAVYVLCEIPPLRAVPTQEEQTAAVDRTWTPPLQRVDISPHTHTREDLSTQSEPLRGPDSNAATRQPHRAAWRQLPAWSAAITPSSKDDMLRAAAELQRRLPILRTISTEHVRSLCREFFLAGWTVIDIHRAIDWRPDGTAWPHSGARDVRDVPGWLKKTRLAAWRVNGTADGAVTRSPSQRSTAEATAAKARARARMAEYARHRQATAGWPRSAAARAALAAARAAASSQVRARTRAHPEI